VMMHPTWWQEAAFRQQDVDLVVDHESRYFEALLKKYARLNNMRAFNFGLPGAMASDDCIIAKTLFCGEHKPKIVVIGTTPRDFIDNRFSHAASSRHYRYLSRFTDDGKLVDLAMPQWWQRIDYYVNSLLYFKGKAQPVQQLLTHEATSLLSPILKSLPPSPLEQVSEEDRKFAMHRAEIQKGVFVAHPTSPYNYVDAVEDCFSRYKTANDPLYNNQRQWFDMCLETLKERGIDVVIVNMPVTSTAQRCMRDGVYARHVDMLKAMAQKYNFAFLDANEEYQKHADQYDFTDWAHMNASGGAKLHDIIARFIASQNALVACLSNDEENGMSVTKNTRNTKDTKGTARSSVAAASDKQL